jgi:formate hydrogenlyase subunit 3/multisubunit Na+/H+ antiporter MnhD subunit
MGIIDMSESIYTAIVWSAILCPLLLAIPLARKFVPWLPYMAIVPALILLLLPVSYIHTLPWLLVGTSMGVDNNSRWMLAMCMIVWLLAVKALNLPQNKNVSPFHLLTLSSSLGMALSADLVSLFIFSSLMGYTFYGVLVQKGNTEKQGAGRLYLRVMIVADLILFEALLLAAHGNANLQFATAHQSIVESGNNTFYLILAILGLTLKLGAWPFCNWVINNLCSASRSNTILLVGLVVSMGLFSVTRWLPLGFSSDSIIAVTTQFFGIAVIIYTLMTCKTNKALSPALFRSSFISIGSILIIVGSALVWSSLWENIGDLLTVLIALLGISLALLASTSKSTIKQ